ncbi:olfactory receptor 10A7-like [Emydura macquarii macquarii]|uniref:olfactory receptor 10A7-like n=1 Tax=Emydura macquarii macquarii TaxID=1129001 RepID=UPI00352B42CF
MAATESILLAFWDLPDMQILLFLVFLVIYIATVGTNTLIVVLIATDRHLHTPMYFLLGNLSFLETCYASTILPRMLLIFWGPNKIDHFYCDSIPLIKLSCSDTHQVMLLDFILACVFTLPPFLLTLTSYMSIIATILRIASSAGRQKSFSTCSSQLIVVTVFYGTIMIVYLRLKHETLRDPNKVFSFCYTVLTPLVKPLTYSLRNREVKAALSKTISKCGFQKIMQRLRDNNLT